MGGRLHFLNVPHSPLGQISVNLWDYGSRLPASFASVKGTLPIIRFELYTNESLL